MLTIAIAQLSRWVNPTTIAQRSWVRHRLPFSCHWAQYFICHTEVLCHMFSWRNCNCSITPIMCLGFPCLSIHSQDHSLFRRCSSRMQLMPCSGLVCALHVHSVSVCRCIPFALEGLSEMNFELEQSRMRAQRNLPISLFRIFQYPEADTS